MDVAERAPVDWLPETARLPFHAPEAVHASASLEVHVSVELEPSLIDDGFDERLTVGAGGGGGGGAPSATCFTWMALT